MVNEGVNLGPVRFSPHPRSGGRGTIRRSRREPVVERMVEEASFVLNIDDSPVEPLSVRHAPSPSLFPRHKAGVGERSPSRRLAGQVTSKENARRGSGRRL